MSAKPLAEGLERLKELRRQGKRRARRTDSDIASSLEDAYEVLVEAGMDDTAELLRQAIERLPPAEQSGSLLRALEIRTLAARVFGDENKAEAWLQRPNRALSGQRPAELLQDELGTSVVRELLEQIDHGIFA